MLARGSMNVQRCIGRPFPSSRNPRRPRRGRAGTIDARPWVVTRAGAREK